jgi:hypothetical protein
VTLDLKALVLGPGGHSSPSDGVSLLEAVSDLAGEPWSNSPRCTSRVIAAYAGSLNDRLGDAERQQLKVYIPRLVGTAKPDLEIERAFACADAAVRVFAPLALAAAGLPEDAATLGALGSVDHQSAESARLAALSAESMARSAASISEWSTTESMRSAAESARSAALSVASAERSAATSSLSAAESAARLAGRSVESAQAAMRLGGRSAESARSAAFELLDRLIAAGS